MQDDALTGLLKADHLAAQGALTDGDFVESVLAHLAKRRRRKTLILNGAAVIGAAIAASQIPVLVHQGPIAAVYLPLLIGSLVIAGTAASFGWAMSR